MTFRDVAKGAIVVASAAVAIPYTTALLSNIFFGWPQTKYKFRRAFSPRKVFALNYTLLQKFLISVRYAPLYLQWKMFYRKADLSMIVKDVAFGRNDRTLDLYLPRPQALTDASNRPVVVFLYGGAWGSGDKKMYGLLCWQIANRLGALVICPNYSLYPQGYVDDMVQDTVDCISWIHENIYNYGGNKDKIMLVGHSAGAHLCIMSVLELLHEEISSVQASVVQSRVTVGEAIQFEDSHFDGSGNSLDKPEVLDGSSGSEGSFSVLSENGNQASSLEASGATSMFEVLTSKDMRESTDIAMPTDVVETLEGVKAEEQHKPEKSKGVSGVHAGEEEEDSGDDDSIVTVRPKDIEGHSLVRLGKSVKAVVGLAGVYHIGDHFLHEMSRGIEDLSSMARAMYGEDHFGRFSPTVIIRNLSNAASLPKVILAHGTEDYTVPLSSSTRFGESLKEKMGDVTVRIIPNCDHYEICLDLMNPNRKCFNPIMGILVDTASRVF